MGRANQVGGEIPPDTKIPRYEYVICGPPLEQISVAEPLASIGETVISPQAWQHVDQSRQALRRESSTEHLERSRKEVCEAFESSRSM